MKKFLAFFGLIVILCGLGAYHVLANQTREVNMSDKKILIAYYSHSGNTKAVAEKIKNTTGGDLFEITPKTPYPNDYNTVVNLAKEEKQQDKRPELADNGSVDGYDIVFVGTPVWWYTMAGPVKTFLTVHNFDGKTIVPFCTHGGGGASYTYSDMQKLAPGAKVLEGYTSYERTASDADVENWIKNLNL